MWEREQLIKGMATKKMPSYPEKIDTVAVVRSQGRLGT